MPISWEVAASDFPWDVPGGGPPGCGVWYIAVVVLVHSLDHTFSRTDGAIFVIGLAAYVSFLIFQGRKEDRRAACDPGAENPASTPARQSRTRNVSLIIVGLVLLVLGSRWLVNSAVSFAGFLVRRVGFELEFSGIDLDATAAVLESQPPARI